MPELGNDLVIDLALELNDQAGKLFHRLPCPLIEFRLVAARWRINGNLAFIPFKAKGKPALGLPTKLALQPDADQVWRQIVIDPTGASARRVTVFMPVSS